MTLPPLAVLGTMHGKAEAIAPPLLQLGISLAVPTLDTDRFGTFTGDVPRKGTMLEAARAKARAAIEVSGVPVGIASEGAYGPHPVIPFVPFGRELLLWLDSTTGQEIVEVIADEEPDFDQAEISEAGELETFLGRIDLASTAVAVARRGDAPMAVAKGLRDRDSIVSAVEAALQQSGRKPVLVQTDMRAHCNRRRMRMIARLAARLAERLSTPCPACGAAGFGVVRHDRGLPCSDCGTATALTRTAVRQCSLCSFEIQSPVGDRRMASPAECPQCNP